MNDTAPVNGAVVQAAREARGWTQAQVAERAALSQGLLSKIESGVATVDGDRAARLADALGSSVSFLSQPIRGADDVRLFHRKRASTPIGAVKQLRADMSVTCLQLAPLVDDRLPRLSLRREDLPEDGYVTPADLARRVRSDWDLPVGPIENLTLAAERAGILVMRHTFPDAKMDAVAVWPRHGFPLVAVNRAAPADRQRFSMAHELGHAVMHDVPTADQESEADQFASELLMPMREIRAELADISLPHLAYLKRKWGVSMAALARRARDLGRISEAAYRSFNIDMAARGLNRAEPAPLEPERPRLLRDILARRIRDGATVGDLAAMARMSPTDFRARYLEEDA